MATVYVNVTPAPDGTTAPRDLIQAQAGKLQLHLVAVDVGQEALNAIQAARKAGVFIPHYCWHPALSVVASCRMCLVQVGERKPDGTVSIPPKVVPACQTPVRDGMVIVADSPFARKSQADTLEGLLLNHPLDCPVCDKAGECLLQDFSYRYGRAQTRMIDEKNTPPNKPYVGENITLFTDRCILCSRCVRFTREVSGQAELQIVNRGHHSEIDIFPGLPLNNKLATNVVDLCPVGALCSKDFLYSQRVWNLRTVDSVCPRCSTGCSIHADGNKNVLYRLRPRENPQAQGYFMCDEGRLGYHYVNDPQRLRKPLYKKENEAKPTPWSEVIAGIRRDFTAAAQQNGASVAGVLSPWLTCEEAYLLAKWLKGLSGQVKLALGPVFVVGEDDTYPKDRRGNPVEPVKFTIRAEKCPNRRGVEEILRHYQGEVIPFAEIQRQAQAGQVQAVYLTAGYPPDGRGWIDYDGALAFKFLNVLVVQDLFPSQVSNHATYLLPAASWVEKDGSFVNHAGLVQEIHWLLTPAGEVRTDGQVYLELLERRGLANAANIRKEMAQEIPAFAPLARGKLGEQGVFLQHA